MRRSSLTHFSLLAVFAGTTMLTVSALTGPNSSASAATAPSTAEPPSITVRGVGRVTGPPDTVTVTLGVETRAATAAAALTANRDRANALVKLLRERQIPDRDIQTSQLSIYPQYDQRGTRITGYQVSNIVTARLRGRIDTAGPLIDAAAAAVGDAVRVQGITFSIEDTKGLLAQARKAAVADAREQATQLTEAAGARLGPLRAIRSSSVNVPPPIALESRAVAAADSAPTPVFGGSQEITAEVELVYDLS